MGIFNRKKKQVETDYHFEKDLFCSMRSIKIPVKQKIVPTDTHLLLDGSDIEELNIMANLIKKLESDVDIELAKDEVFKEQYNAVLTKLKSIVRKEILENPVRLIVRTNNHSLYFVDKQGEFFYDVDGSVYTINKGRTTLYKHHSNDGPEPERFSVNDYWALDSEARKWI